MARLTLHLHRSMEGPMITIRTDPNDEVPRDVARLEPVCLRDQYYMDVIVQHADDCNRPHQYDLGDMVPGVNDRYNFVYYGFVTDDYLETPAERHVESVLIKILEHVTRYQVEHLVFTPIPKYATLLLTRQVLRIFEQADNCHIELYTAAVRDESYA